MKYAIAVIDIGMTNKKVAIYNESLEQLDAVYKNFQPVMVEDPSTKEKLESHDLDGMKKWFFEEIKKFAAKYPIQAISVTTHGATFVCLDKNGNISVPCIFYTHENGEEFHQDFYKLVGDKDVLQKETSTPPLSAMVNPAKGIYFAKTHFTDQFAQTETILNYPQYWGFVFTGKKGFEPTYIGCHTYLWNHEKMQYSKVADTLGIRNMLPQKLQNSYEVLGTLTKTAACELNLSESTIVTMGIHDSNASLLPYLAKDDHADFVLNSTGTWCVCMHPQEKLGFNPDDIGKIVFFNQSALRKPVKTAIFLGGMEFDTYTTLYREITHNEKFPSSDMQTCERIFSEKNLFLLPELISGSGQFTASKAGIMEDGIFYPYEQIKSHKKIPAIFEDEKKFCALLIISLVIQTEFALIRSGLKDGTKIFTEGGFRKNNLYNALTASVLPKNPLYLTDMNEATACGAAMTAVMALTNKTHRQLADTVHIDYKHIVSEQIVGYESYKTQWLQLATGEQV